MLKRILVARPEPLKINEGLYSVDSLTDLVCCEDGVGWYFDRATARGWDVSQIYGSLEHAMQAYSDGSIDWEAND